MHILGISGSLRAGSFNTAALRTCKLLLPSGVRLEISTSRLSGQNADRIDRMDGTVKAKLIRAQNALG